MKTKRVKQIALLFSISLFFISLETFARAGGGGGGGSSSGGGGWSGGGGSHDYGSGGSGSGGNADPGLVVTIIVIGIIIYLIKDRFTKGKGYSDEDATDRMPDKPLPSGLDKQKIQTSFLSIQEAWQKKELKHVRKWISDGVYQRFNAQFEMMNKLQQTNYLSNIRINAIKLAQVQNDGSYQTADVAVSFTMDDEFISKKYPEFNQKFDGESAMEYWTFIKRNDAQTNKNLYDNNNCPNCGAPFDVNMGEISRCSSCGTLTNNASYDWVLSEITQENDYSSGAFKNYDQLRELTKNDDLFSVQRVQDVASNVFMQIMEVLSGADEKKLTRFADVNTAQSILQLKKQWGNFVFDRLYLNNVDLATHNVDADRLNLVFSLKATYQRVRADEKLSLIDNDMVSKYYSMVLSKNLKGIQTPAKETVYSYECSNCGGPYTDTTNDVCPYCSAPVIDLNKNWVLTMFKIH